MKSKKLGINIYNPIYFTLSYIIYCINYSSFFIAIIIYTASRALLYTLPYYISFDTPELSSKECVKKSEELMKGNRGNFFMLMLSFIGWGFLTLFTLGIGMLWLTPYMQIAAIGFYEKLLKSSAETIEEVINTK